MRRVFRSFGLLGLGGLLCASPAMAATPTSKSAKVSKKKDTAKSPESRHKQHLEYLSIMRKEMNRNLAFFSKRPRPKVFYLRYMMEISRGVSLRATNGVITASADTRKKPFRRVHVGLRVGDHKFDQTGRDGYDWKIYRSLLPASTYCPRELTSSVLRKILWQNTDRKYRIAFGRYWRKRYVRSLKPKILDKAGDFSKEPPAIYMKPVEGKLTFDKKRWKSILKRVSKLTKNSKYIVSSNVTLSASEKVRLGIANDGSQVRQIRRSYNWSISLSYLSGKTKEYVSNSDSGYAQTEDKLPSEKWLTDKFRALWKDVKERVASEEGDPDEGPAIVGPLIAGAMFYDILMVQLETGRFLRKSAQRAFAKKLGKQIIPSFLSIVDDPTRKFFRKTPLSSHYLFDDQWVAARRMVMIKDGVLKNFYMSRKPYKSYKRSNGHGRAAFGYNGFSRPGTTIVSSKKAYSLDVLRKKLLAEMKKQGKRYGYILTKFQGYSRVYRGTYSLKPAKVLRLDAKTGKLERLKGLQVNMPSLQVIRGILATGNDYTVFNGSDSENSGNIPITTVSPSLLLQRLVFRRIDLTEKKDFTLPPPFKHLSLKQIVKKRKAKKEVNSCVDICKQCAACQKKK